MLKKKMISFVCICLLLLLALAFTCLFGNMSANAASIETNSPAIEEVNIENAEPRGLFATISVMVSGGNGVVTATAHNDFTLFPSTIATYIELYSSSTYKESFSDMVFEGSNYTSDLNIYESLEFSKSTNGESKYWQARVRYKFDSDNWTEKNTGTYLFDAQGNMIN